MQGLGGTGAQQSKDCSFPAGSVSGAPLRVSWFLVIFFLYQLIDAFNAPGLPIWVRVVTVTGNEFLLLLTVLCHEMGHGTMARRRGGDIAEVLLWPFGGICFTTRAQGRNSTQKLVDDLWIVAAGPATHFPMVGVWYALLAMLAAYCSEVDMDPIWRHLVPFRSATTPCLDWSAMAPRCFHTWGGYLVYSFFVQAVQLNVMLFMFNVFFPMYPMDGAKLIVCSLQLFCKVSAKCAARVLIYTSVPLSVFFIGKALLGFRGGGLQPGLMAYMGFMCLAESWKIYRLMREERLYTHPLFELARSSVREVNDPLGGITVRLNHAERDDEEARMRAPQVQFSELRPFSGAGRSLGGEVAAPSGAAGGTTGLTQHADVAAGADGSTREARGVARTAWLDRVEQQAAERKKTVRELEDERLERERLTGKQAAKPPL